MVLVQLIDIEIDKHTVHARLAKLLGSQPPEYDDLAREAFARTLLLSPALAAKSEQVGLFASGTFERLGVPAYHSFSPASASQPPPPGHEINMTGRLPQLQLDAAPEPEFVGTVMVSKEKRAASQAN